MRFGISTEVVYLQRWHGWCHMKLLPSRRVLCTPYNHAPCHFMQSHIRKVHACSDVTGHLRFWQNDRGLLRATAVTLAVSAVTRGWDGYRNKSQHRKSTLEKKILPPLLQGFEPVTFRSRVRRSNHWAIPICIENQTRTERVGNLRYTVSHWTVTSRSVVQFPQRMIVHPVVITITVI